MLDKFYITAAGKVLLAKAQTGVELRYTRMQMGQGYIPDGLNIEEMTALSDPVKYLPIASLNASGGIASVGVQMSNAGLEHAVYFREVGLFADDPDRGEILYAYGNAGKNADFIPAAAESQVDYTFTLNCTVGNAPNITIHLQPSRIYATQEELTAHIIDYKNPHRITKEQLGVTEIIVSETEPEIEAPFLWFRVLNSRGDEGTNTFVLIETEQPTPYSALIDERSANIENLTDNLNTTKPGDMVVLEY